MDEQVLGINAMDCSGNNDGSETPRQELDANAWQLERVNDGLAAARAGRVRPAEDVFADIAAKHGWER